jgi:hypothetical protein
VRGRVARLDDVTQLAQRCVDVQLLLLAFAAALPVDRQAEEQVALAGPRATAPRDEQTVALARESQRDDSPVRRQIECLCFFCLKRSVTGGLAVSDAVPEALHRVDGPAGEHFFVARGGSLVLVYHRLPTCAPARRSRGNGLACGQDLGRWGSRKLEPGRGRARSRLVLAELLLDGIEQLALKRDSRAGINQRRAEHRRRAVCGDRETKCLRDRKTDHDVAELSSICLSAMLRHQGGAQCLLGACKALEHRLGSGASDALDGRARASERDRKRCLRHEAEHRVGLQLLETAAQTDASTKEQILDEAGRVLIRHLVGLLQQLLALTAAVHAVHQPCLPPDEARKNARQQRCRSRSGGRQARQMAAAAARRQAPALRRR